MVAIMEGQRGKPCEFHTCILNEYINFSVSKWLGLGSIAIEYLDGNTHMKSIFLTKADPQQKVTKAISHH